MPRHSGIPQIEAGAQVVNQLFTISWANSIHFEGDVRQLALPLYLQRN